MNQILKKLKHLTFSYFYIYSVVIVVFTIIIACYVFMSNLEREHLRFEVNNEISYVQNDIVRDFHEHEVALTNIAEVILRKIKYGESADTIREYLQSISNSKLFSHNSENHKIIDLQGFFEVFGDKPPTDEPWYKKAIEAKGNVAFIEPVWDFALNMIVVAYAINILDENGKSLGSLYLKLDFNNIIERVCNMQTINNGWGILLNSKLIVIAHKNRDFISHHIDSINIGIRVFSNDFKQKTEFSEQEMINYLNEKAITFFKLIDNDLYLGVVMPKNKYYHNINYMTKMLIIFSVIFLFVYAIISIRFIRAREKEKMNVIIREKNLKLEETAHWYKSILDAVPLPISVTNVKTEWVFVNKATVNFLGVKQEDIMGKLCNLWKSDICNTENCGIECIKKGIKRTYFTQNDLSFQVDTEILRDLHGEVSGYVEIVQDITEVQEMARKQANAEESDRLKSAFLANMSHEIRTPLNAIVGFSHLLVSKNYDEEKRQTFLSRIKSNSNQLLVIIEDVLDISKIESGQLTLNYEWIDLNALLQEILEDMQLHIQDKDIALFCQKSLPDAEVHIKVDNVRLKQVLTNLILNAIKFTTQGFINFGYVQKDTMLEFFVKDSGIGIAKENQKQIFEYFRQEDESTTRKFGGNGLGLSIAKQLVELMGGKIRVESEKDKGATFFFTIPYIVSQQSHALMVVPPEEKKLNKQHIIPKITITDKKILIVDDVDSTFILISEILSKYNVNLHHVDRGEKSVEFVKENPDTTIIFMDIHMPGITGVEAMKLIKAINPDIPIVAQTAFAMKEDKEKFIKEGFDGYITKPLQESDLLKIFKRFFMQ